MCAARPPGLQDLLGILHCWLKSQLSLKQRLTLRFNLKGVSNTVTGLQNWSQTETQRRFVGTQLLRPLVLMTNAPIHFSKRKDSGQMPRWVLYKKHAIKSILFTPWCGSEQADVLHSPKALCKIVLRLDRRFAPALITPLNQPRPSSSIFWSEICLALNTNPLLWENHTRKHFGL